MAKQNDLEKEGHNMLKLFSILFLLASCSHSVHQVTMSDHNLNINPKMAKKIHTLSEQKVIFWFTFDTNYVESAKSQLEKQCPQGEVTNIMTRYSTSHGFFHWTNKIYMEGLCLNKSS